MVDQTCWICRKASAALQACDRDRAAGPRIEKCLTLVQKIPRLLIPPGHRNWSSYAPRQSCGKPRRCICFETEHHFLLACNSGQAPAGGVFFPGGGLRALPWDTEGGGTWGHIGASRGDAMRKERTAVGYHAAGWYDSNNVIPIFVILGQFGWWW